jgi:hypothetical protein
MALCLWALANAARRDWSVRRFTELFDQSEKSRCPADGLAALGGTVKVQDVCIFGDDIIIPVDHVDRTIGLIEAVGFKVNSQKSYVKGPFRESCGVDCYSGVNVTPVRVKNRLNGYGVDVVFRTCDLFNRISYVYGETDPNVCLKLRELFQEFFGFKPPLEPSNGDSGASGLILYDYHWMQTEPGDTLRRGPRGVGFRLVKALHRFECHAKIKRRVLRNSKGEEYVKHTQQPNYQRYELRVLTEVADEATRDLGWSSVLRSFAISGGRGGTDKYAFRKRVHHKLAWIHP